MTAADDEVEDEADDSPCNVVDGSRGRDETCAIENDGPAKVKKAYLVYFFIWKRNLIDLLDVTEDGVGPFTSHEPGNDREGHADDEEEQ